MSSPDNTELTFRALHEANEERCEDVFHAIEEWSPTDWACALAGEVGELCNFIKKMRRGEDVAIGDVADEIADVQIYLDLLANRLGISLELATISKFNRISVKRGSDVRL